MSKPISVLVVRSRVREKYRDIENDIISLTSKNESGGSLTMQGEANLSFGCKIGSEREI